MVALTRVEEPGAAVLPHPAGEVRREDAGPLWRD